MRRPENEIKADTSAWTTLLQTEKTPSMKSKTSSQDPSYPVKKCSRDRVHLYLSHPPLGLQGAQKDSAAQAGEHVSQCGLFAASGWGWGHCRALWGLHRQFGGRGRSLWRLCGEFRGGGRCLWSGDRCWRLAGSDRALGLRLPFAALTEQIGVWGTFAPVGEPLPLLLVQLLLKQLSQPPVLLLLLPSAQQLSFTLHQPVQDQRSRWRWGGGGWRQTEPFGQCHLLVVLLCSLELRDLPLASRRSTVCRDAKLLLYAVDWRRQLGLLTLWSGSEVPRVEDVLLWQDVWQIITIQVKTWPKHLWCKIVADHTSLAAKR